MSRRDRILFGAQGWKRRRREALIVSERQSRRVARARSQWGNYGITGAGIWLATRNFLSWRRGIVDDSGSRIWDFGDIVRRTQVWWKRVCFLGGRRRRGIIRRYRLVIGLFIVLRGIRDKESYKCIRFLDLVNFERFVSKLLSFKMIFLLTCPRYCDLNIILQHRYLSSAIKSTSFPIYHFVIEPMRQRSSHERLILYIKFLKNSSLSNQHPPRWNEFFIQQNLPPD